MNDKKKGNVIMSDSVKTKVLIIGSGPAGYTAAIYAARASLEPVLVQGLQPGGQLTITTDVENYPGFADVIQGPWLMEQMRLQAEHVGTKLDYDIVTDIDLSRRPFVATADSGQVYEAETVIIATGAQARWLDVPGEETFKGYGVSACATCDGFFYKDREVLVVGGGNTAAEEALFLTNFAARVRLIHRRDALRAEHILTERVKAHPKIEVVWDSVVEEIRGKSEFPPTMTDAVIRNVKTGELSTLTADGLFVAIGHDPATELFRGKLKMDDHGYILTAPDSTETSVPGVFAAGDVKDQIYRQAVTAAGMGCMAALEADRFLAEAALDLPSVAAAS